MTSRWFYMVAHWAKVRQHPLLRPIRRAEEGKAERRAYMSVEADFGLSGWVGQASGTQLSWDITWGGELEDSRFAAVSFQSDFNDTQLVRVSEWFSTDTHANPHVGELIRAHSGIAPGAIVAFRFAVVVIPNR
jgi:hypothetical protein